MNGSIDEGTATYRKQGTFQLLQYHHVQKEPFFSKHVDFTVAAPIGMISIWIVDKNGKIQVQGKPMGLPADLANGFVPAVAVVIGQVGDYGPVISSDLVKNSIEK